MGVEAAQRARRSALLPANFPRRQARTPSARAARGSETTPPATGTPPTSARQRQDGFGAAPGGRGATST